MLLWNNNKLIWHKATNLEVQSCIFKNPNKLSLKCLKCILKFHIGTKPILQIYPLIFIIKFDTKAALTLSWRKFLSHRNQSIGLHGESMDWFLCDRDFVIKELTCFYYIWIDVIRGALKTLPNIYNSAFWENS